MAFIILQSVSFDLVLFRPIIVRLVHLLFIYIHTVGILMTGMMYYISIKGNSGGKSIFRLRVIYIYIPL